MGINGSFRFHKVGQGLFYSGILNSGKDLFTFVYDCGSTSPRCFLNQEIDDFKNLLPPSHKAIDLLIVSHLHDDHVNGLERLLSGLKVGTVVMPYISKELRFLAKLESQLDDTFLFSFYGDPVSWFVSHGADHILLVGSNEDNNIQSNNRPNTELSGFNIEGIIGTERSGDTYVYYTNHMPSISSYRFDWLFAFENLDFKNISDAFRKSEYDYLREYSIKYSDIFRSRESIRGIKEKIYKNCPYAKRAINRTSVVMAHQPECNSALFCSSNYHGWNYKGDNHNAFTTLIAGDIEIDSNDHLQTKRDYFKGLVLQYPHHGSKNNTINDLYYFFVVFSYGIANKYGHPDIEAVELTHCPIHVTERQAFDYQIMTY